MTDTPADLVLTADRIHTMSAAVGATSVAIRGGVVVAVGGEGEVAGFIGPDTRSLRYPGATIVPGLSDAHAHPISGAGFAVGMDLRGVTSLPGLRRELATALASLKPGDWLRGWGLDPNVWGPERVSRPHPSTRSSAPCRCSFGSSTPTRLSRTRRRCGRRGSRGSARSRPDREWMSTPTASRRDTFSRPMPCSSFSTCCPASRSRSTRPG